MIIFFNILTSHGALTLPFVRTMGLLLDGAMTCP